jgi:hypothetical protein
MIGRTPVDLVCRTVDSRAESRADCPAVAHNPSTSSRTRVLLVAFMLVAACGLGRRQNIQVQTFPWTNMSAYQTYRWWQPPLEYGRGHNELEADLDRKIRFAVDRQLLNRGYAEATTGPPDFVLQYGVALHEAPSTAFRDYLSHRADGGGEGGLARYPEGTLTLEAVEPSSRRIVWRATAGDAIEPGPGTNLVEPAVWGEMSHFPARP